VNVVTEPLLAAMDSSSERLPPEESEFDHVGVERAPCRRIDAPRVAEAAVTMECTLHDSLSVHGRLVILGDVEYLHVSEAVLTDGTIDMRKLPTVGRLGGPYYTVSDRVEFERQF
jgi:flavin reductase (DIM6/NTAB) family NADH-FMN oxidoreductase RutF